MEREAKTIERNKGIVHSILTLKPAKISQAFFYGSFLFINYNGEQLLRFSYKKIFFVIKITIL